MQVNTRYMHKLHKRNFVSFVYSLMLAISENGIYFIKLWVAVSKGEGGRVVRVRRQSTILCDRIFVTIYFKTHNTVHKY